MVENKKYVNKYNFAFIDEATKKEIRRKLLKAVAIPGYQVPYSSPERPISRGWGTGGLHVTLAIIGKADVFKIIDQGSDASVNACNLREFVHMMTNCKTTFDTREATLIQTRHRVTEEELNENQIYIYQVPQPEPLRGVERYENKTRQMHGEADYAKMWVSLYEQIVRHGDIMLGAGYPVKVNDRYIMAPSPIPKWDCPNINQSKALHLFGAGREKRLYAVPPYTKVEPLEFEDIKFHPEDFTTRTCFKTGYNKAYLDELYFDDGTRHFVINDSNFLDKMVNNEPIKQHSNKYLSELKNGAE